GVLIRLEDAERISFGIEKVALPADAGHREFRKRYRATPFQNGLGNHVVVNYLKRTDIGICTAVWRRWRRRPFEETAATAVARVDAPVFDGRAVCLCELPAEDAGVKASGALRLLRLDFKVDHPHGCDAPSHPGCTAMIPHNRICSASKSRSSPSANPIGLLGRQRSGAPSPSI